MDAPPDELLPKAREAARRALEIDESLAEAHASLGLVKDTYEQDWKGAGEAFKKAIELKPNYATAHHWYRMHLASLGLYDEALEEIDIAQRLDPLSLPIRMGRGWILCGAQRYDESIDVFEDAHELNPSSSAPLFGLAYVYCELSYFQMSLEYIERVSKTQDWRRTGVNVHLANIYARMGRKREAHKMLDKITAREERDHVRAAEIAQLCFALGYNDGGFAWLEKAFTERDSGPRLMKAFRSTYPAESDPRFRAILKRVGLEE